MTAPMTSPRRARPWRSSVGPETRYRGDRRPTRTSPASTHSCATSPPRTSPRSTSPGPTTWAPTTTRTWSRSAAKNSCAAPRRARWWWFWTCAAGRSSPLGTVAARSPTPSTSSPSGSPSSRSMSRSSPTVATPTASSPTRAVQLLRPGTTSGPPHRRDARVAPGRPAVRHHRLLTWLADDAVPRASSPDAHRRVPVGRLAVGHCVGIGRRGTRRSRLSDPAAFRSS